jgi:hypothetical protein
MRVLIVFLLGVFVVGGTSLGRWTRDHPVVLTAASALVAASYYSLRIAR